MFRGLSGGGLSRSSTYAAIHENARPGNVTCARSGEEGNGLCDLSGLTIAGNRQTWQDRRCESAIGGVHVGVDWARPDRIDGNVPRTSSRARPRVKLSRADLVAA